MDDLVNKSKVGRLSAWLTGRSFQGYTVGCLAKSIHGAISPQAQRTMIARGVNMKAKRTVVKKDT